MLDQALSRRFGLAVPLEVRRIWRRAGQAPEQPDHRDVAVALHLQPTARSHPVQIQIGWANSRGGPPTAGKPGAGEIRIVRLSTQSARITHIKKPLDKKGLFRCRR